MKSLNPLILGGLMLFALRVGATTHYVNVGNPAPVSPYTSWPTAATNIQDAVGLAGVNDVVIVTNGIYQYGGASASGSNRVYAIVAVKIQSVNGPGVTIIKGNQVPGSTNGSSAMRCVYLGEFSTLSGFTLTGGATQTGGNGGGVYAVANCIVSNCVITGNASSGNGGGCFGTSSLLVNCVIGGNWSGASGGGANNCLLNYCIVTNNFALNGGGMASGVANNCLFTGNGNTNGVGGTSGGAAYLATLNNCTVVGNFSHGLGAADGCKLANSIVFYNDNGIYADCYQCQLTNCCTTLGLGNSILSNNSISNPPAFVDPAHSDFHLQVFSPCLNAGTNLYVTSATDLDGNPRIVNGTVDMGAYENQNTNPVHFVWVSNAGPVSPFTNWLTAATNIQDAVDATGAGDFIVVSNGVYQSGGRVVFGTMTNRLVVDKAVTVQSVNGPAATIIAGLPGTGSYLSSGYRCVYLTNGAALIGFTLTNGASRLGGTDLVKEQSGAAVWCEAANAVVSNCVLTHSYANEYGGAAYQGTFNNCMISNNTAFIGGGGTYLANLNNCVVSNNKLIQGTGGGGTAYGTLSNCLITWNTAWSGGGAYYSTLTSCVVSNNSAGSFGGGVCFGIINNSLISSNRASSGGGACSNALYDCILKNNYASSSIGGGGGAYGGVLVNCTVVSNAALIVAPALTVGGVLGGSCSNCIVYYNSAAGDSNFLHSIPMNYSCTYPLPTNGLGNFTNAPLFVNLTNDFHLQSNSPCINAGNNAYVTTSTDLDGNPRIAGGTVDVGAYEYQTPASILSYAWAQQYGLPTDGSVDTVDTDGDGLSNYAEWKSGTSPTDAASVLQLASPSSGVSGITVTWQSVTNVTYYLQRSGDLTGGFTSIVSNLVGQTGSTTYLDTGATGDGPYFYRVGVQ